MFFGTLVAEMALSSLRSGLILSPLKSASAEFLRLDFSACDSCLFCGTLKGTLVRNVVEEIRRSPPEMYKVLLKNGTNYQPQLVIGGFLNHQQYQPIFSHKTSCQAARRCGCRCVGLDIDGPPEAQRTSGQLGVWTRFLALHQVHWTGSCPCRWSGRWSLVLLVALWYVAATWGKTELDCVWSRVETRKTETRPVISPFKAVISFYLPLEVSP